MVVVCSPTNTIYCEKTMLGQDFEDLELQRAIDASLGKDQQEDEDEQMRRVLEESRKMHEESKHKPDPTLASLNEFLKSLNLPKEIISFLNANYAQYLKECPIYSPKLKVIDFKTVNYAFKSLPDEARNNITTALTHELNQTKDSFVNSFSLLLQFEDPEFAFVSLIDKAQEHEVKQEVVIEDEEKEDAELQQALALSKQTEVEKQQKQQKQENQEKETKKSTTPAKRRQKDSSSEEKVDKSSVPAVAAPVAAISSEPAPEYQAHQTRMLRIFSFMLKSIEAANLAIEAIEKQVPNKSAQGIKDQMALIQSYERSTKAHSVEGLKAFIDGLNQKPEPAAAVLTTAFDSKRRKKTKEEMPAQAAQVEQEVKKDPRRSQRKKGK